ncbi:hypothetical protein [Acinetobacter baumannii]|uniref:hypothetical protein n=1 Tax=Acinetobacter baumannii TaxID=470 RepID=UPI0013156D07|nr:hypothetical protein [Acinetobacter baumannii]MBD8884166.1 hypothetical protein [Acinetobacter baumannii]
MDHLEQVLIHELIDFLNEFQEKHNCRVESINLEDDSIETAISERILVRMS